MDASEETTPVTIDACRDCGSELVVIGVSAPPPGTENIWTTIFATRCVRALGWRWCSKTGHLSIWLRMPTPDKEGGGP